MNSNMVKSLIREEVSKILNESYHPEDEILSGITYKQLMIAVENDTPNPTKSDVVRIFKSMVEDVVEDAKYELKQNMDQILEGGLMIKLTDLMKEETLKPVVNGPFYMNGIENGDVTKNTYACNTKGDIFKFKQEYKGFLLFTKLTKSYKKLGKLIKQAIVDDYNNVIWDGNPRIGTEKNIDPWHNWQYQPGMGGLYRAEDFLNSSKVKGLYLAEI